MAIGILGLGERQRVRLFVSRDQLDRFAACVLCLPRDRFNTENRERAGRILADAFGGGQVDWAPQITESVLVRVNYVVHCPEGVPEDVDVAAIEARIARATRNWSDDLRAALVAAHGEVAGRRASSALRHRVPARLPGGLGVQRRAARYRADRGAATAPAGRSSPCTGRSVRSAVRSAPSCSRGSRWRCLTCCPPSSTSAPRSPTSGPTRSSRGSWPRSGCMTSASAGRIEQLERIGDTFAAAFLGVWAGEFEDDGFNGLVLAAGLTGREITIVRAIARYLRQAADRVLGCVYGADPDRQPGDRRAARAPVPSPPRSRALMTPSWPSACRPSSRRRSTP